MFPDDRVSVRDIALRKREEVLEAQRTTAVESFRERVEAMGAPRNFFSAVINEQQPRYRAGGTAVIAELVRRDGSGAWLRPEYASEMFDPAVIAQQYQRAGAAAISCPTDRPIHGGGVGDLAKVREACTLPVLRRDFIVDPWQVWESRAAGADAINLIADILTLSELIDLMILARELQLTTVLEVQDAADLMRVTPHLGFPSRSYFLLAINNHSFTTLRDDLGQSLRLSEYIDDLGVVISEGGVERGEDLRRLRRAGVRIALIGERLMREAEPGAALEQLEREARPAAG